MNNFNILTRRAFLDRSFKVGLGVALSTLVDIPLVMKRALAEGTIGNGKKLLFIFLRGANDSLNTLIPVLDTAYNTVNRPNLCIQKDSGGDPYYATVTGQIDTAATATSSNPADPNYRTFWYDRAIRAGNGFAALHPSLKFLGPVYNAGHLAIVHRVGYPYQSRSHFDSQNYWENGNPNNNLIKDGIFYRTIIESGLAGTTPQTGVSIQSALPLILRGSAAALTNLSDPTRYNLLGIPNTTAGNAKADNAVLLANGYPFPDKKSRDLLSLQYQNMAQTLSIFAGLDFSETGNTYTDDAYTDGDLGPYNLFPTQDGKNGGAGLHSGDAQKYVVNKAAYPFFTNLKAAAIVLNKTDAVIAGTEMTGFDTHSSQGTVIVGGVANGAGTQPRLLSQIGWAMYALRKYFMKYGRNGSANDPTAKCSWDDVVVVTLSEFGRTTIENGNAGTDHAEAGVMFLAGGQVHGGIYGCNTSDNYNGQPVQWIPGPANQGGNNSNDGSMFGVQDRYLKRIIDYRSILGELIRDHLGATSDQLKRIIPGYADLSQKLDSPGGAAPDGTTIAGELNLV